MYNAPAPFVVNMILSLLKCFCAMLKNNNNNNKIFKRQCLCGSILGFNFYSLIFVPNFSLVSCYLDFIGSLKSG